VQMLYGNVIFLYFEKFEVSQGLQLNNAEEKTIELLSLQTKLYNNGKNDKNISDI